MFVAKVLFVIGVVLSSLQGAEPEWFDFNPGPDAFTESPIDLRHLNEKFAGEHGRIEVKDGKFVHRTTGVPVRFWGVNGPPHNLATQDLKRAARMLAKYGVNMIRIHTAAFNEKGEVDGKKLDHAAEVVMAMKEEGIYSHFSIYFPLWIKPGKESLFLRGYDGSKHPFAALMFNQQFQERYKEWWKALLNTKLANGTPLLNEPSVAGLEIQNEDSFFFWTFAENNLPEEQRSILEGLFGDWLKSKYKSLEGAFTAWNESPEGKDRLAENRVAFRPLWNIANQKTLRDQDTARFLLETQTKFYQETIQYLRKLGYEGLITASNWSTASPEVLGPLEKLSYTVGDFVDRHGYFGSNHKGPNSEWSIREGHTYSDRSAYRFDPEQAGKPKVFVHPGMDVHYNNKPSMISETTWNRPNRYRSEAPIYLAAFGSLQHSDAIIHFAHNGIAWSVKPQYWMQPWTLTSPAMMGQFPAAALIYRLGLVTPGQTLASINLNTNDLLQLKGTPLPQDAALDELRLKDLPKITDGAKVGQRIDPLIHFAGRTDVTFSGEPAKVSVQPLEGLIDHAKQSVSSSTKELRLDYGKGVLVMDGPRVQGVSGNVRALGEVQTKYLTLKSDSELLHVVMVPLDKEVIAKSRRLLLQVMSEERNSGFATESAGEGIRRIKALGKDPWQVRGMSGEIEFELEQLQTITSLDLNGYKKREPISGKKLKLDPDTMYYLLEGK